AGHGGPTMKRTLLLLVLAVLAGTPPALAQVGSDPITGHFAGGWVSPQGKTGDAVDSGWNFSGGATFYTRPNSPVGLRLDFDYNWFYASQDTINSANGGSALVKVDDGFASMTTISLEAVHDFRPKGHIGGYIGLGAGMYTRYWQ